MKIRSGFVSNSSTTSFCIMGVSFNDENELSEYCNYGNPVIDNTDLTYFSRGGWYSSSIYYLGVSITEMQEDETKQEFKERAERVIKEQTGQDVECKFITMGWREG